MSWLTPPLWEFQDAIKGEQTAIRIDRINAISRSGEGAIIMAADKLFLIERPFDEIVHRWRLSLTLDFPLDAP